MNLTSKQRAYLGSEASTMNAIFQIGKASLTPELINGLDEALEKRELIKISVLKNCADDPREIAEIIAERTHSVVVKVIGKKIILFRQAHRQVLSPSPEQCPVLPGRSRKRTTICNFLSDKTYSSRHSVPLRFVSFRTSLYKRTDQRLPDD